MTIEASAPYALENLLAARRGDPLRRAYEVPMYSDASRLTSPIAFYDLLMRHIDGVVAWARHRLTNAALEGNNARVRAISQRAHGPPAPRSGSSASGSRGLRAQVRKGTWPLTVRVFDDEPWAQVKTTELSGPSIGDQLAASKVHNDGAVARRHESSRTLRSVDLRVGRELPDVVAGSPPVVVRAEVRGPH